MGYAMTHAVQSYVRTKAGRFGQSPIQECESADGAVRLARRLVEEGRALGAMAFSRRINPEDGYLEMHRVIGTFGVVCDPADEIPF